MTTEFTWTWKTKILGQIYDVKIYKDNVLFGHIPDIFLNEIAVINSKQFLKQTHKSNFKHYTFIVDPAESTVLCQIKEGQNREVVAYVDKDRKYDVGISLDDNPNQNNNLAVQLYKDKMFFAKSGKLEVRSNENIELLIVCAFYSYMLRLTDID
ncbi:MAG: hypothetical protein U0W65_00920 [Bacteroidia bacterium]